MKNGKILVLAYLVSITAANLGIATFGIQYAPLFSFLFIGFDLTARDLLHQYWSGQNLRVKMFGLVCLGSLLSAVLSGGNVTVAAASGLAFLLAGVVDFLVYSAFRPKWLQVNGSNVAGALVDTVVFVGIVSGGVSLPLVTAVAATKIFGGFFWWLLLSGAQRLRVARLSR